MAAPIMKYFAFSHLPEKLQEVSHNTQIGDVTIWPPIK
jgi:hypothetical protein